MSIPTPPPMIVSSEMLRAGELTPAAAARHAARIKSELDGLEALVSELPDGEFKSRLKRRALRLHNALGQGGRALNAHFQTAEISPDSAGGDKDGDGDDKS